MGLRARLWGYFPVCKSVSFAGSRPPWSRIQLCASCPTQCWLHSSWAPSLLHLTPSPEHPRWPHPHRLPGCNGPSPSPRGPLGPSTGLRCVPLDWTASSGPPCFCLLSWGNSQCWAVFKRTVFIFNCLVNFVLVFYIFTSLPFNFLVFI